MAARSRNKAPLSSASPRPENQSKGNNSQQKRTTAVREDRPRRRIPLTLARRWRAESRSGSRRADVKAGMKAVVSAPSPNSRRNMFGNSQANKKVPAPVAPSIRNIKMSRRKPSARDTIVSREIFEAVRRVLNEASCMPSARDASRPRSRWPKCSSIRSVPHERCGGLPWQMAGTRTLYRWRRG